MTLFTYHIADAQVPTVAEALLRPPTSKTISGLKHAECMIQMKLGTPIISLERMQLRTLNMFAAWENRSALEEFLEKSELGRLFSNGWHVRMEFMRRWGHISEFDGLPSKVGIQDPAAPVVAVTLARMKFLQIPRFISWGLPVEKLVRDHPGTTYATAAMRPLNTVATFTIWRTQQEMVDMVRGHSAVPQPKRHADAMVERKRKNFHFEFTTLRFKAIAEYGEWEGRKLLPH